MSHADAEALFARLSAWLGERGVARGANVTELEFGRLARARLGRDEPLRFISEFYLPAAYGHGPRITAEEAAALLDALIAPPKREKPAGGGPGSADGASSAPSDGTPDGGAASEETPPSAGPRKCLSCGEALA